MFIDPQQLNTRDIYTWMTHTIIPRPIAWVSTLSSTGVSNLAPFSFFNAVCARPPTLMFCPVNDRYGRPKDTLRNIEATGEFVVNLAPWNLASMLNDTAASLPPDVSEFERFGVKSLPSSKVKPPRVAEVRVAYECTLDRIVRISEGAVGGNVVFGTVVALHVADEILGPDGWPVAEKLDPLARLGGNEYSRLGESLSLARPD
jgi:flavin reductase (DIM6/NTAB) family NADH-FMN oxidoreductase RutF